MRRYKRYIGPICKAHLIYSKTIEPGQIKVNIIPGNFETLVPKKPKGQFIINLPPDYKNEDLYIWGRIHEEYHASLATQKFKRCGHPKFWAGYPSFYSTLAIECLVEAATSNYLMDNGFLPIVDKAVQEYTQTIWKIIDKPSEISYEQLFRILPAAVVAFKLNLFNLEDIARAWSNVLISLGFLTDERIIKEAFYRLFVAINVILNKKGSKETKSIMIGSIMILIPPRGRKNDDDDGDDESRRSSYDPEAKPREDIDIERLLEELRKRTKFINLPKKISVVRDTLTIENFGRRFRVSKLAKAVATGDTTALFKKFKSGVRGVIMMDLSGSMSPDVKTISEIIRAFPGTEVYGYFGTSDSEHAYGRILKISDGYKVAHPKDLRDAITGSGNSIDLLAVQFMLDRKREKKLNFAIFISDGGFCGGPSGQANAAMALLLRSVNHRDILWFRTWESVQENLFILTRHINRVCR